MGCGCNDTCNCSIIAGDGISVVASGNTFTISTVAAAPATGDLLNVNETGGESIGEVLTVTGLAPLTAAWQAVTGAFLPLTGGALTGSATSTGNFTALFGTTPVDIGTVTDGVGIEFGGNLHQIYDLSPSTWETRSSIRINDAGTTAMDLIKGQGTISLRKSGSYFEAQDLANTNSRLIRGAVSGGGTSVELRMTKLLFGDGTGTFDVEIGRESADLISTPDRFKAVDGITTKVKAGTPVDGDFAQAPEDGTIVIDTTADKIWVRIGGVWKQTAALT